MAIIPNCLSQFTEDIEATCLIDEIIERGGNQDMWDILTHKLVHNIGFHDSYTIMDGLKQRRSDSRLDPVRTEDLVELKHSVITTALQKFGKCQMGEHGGCMAGNYF